MNHFCRCGSLCSPHSCSIHGLKFERPVFWEEGAPAVTMTDAPTSDEDEQNEEMEALAAIYGEDFMHHASERRMQVGHAGVRDRNQRW